MDVNREKITELARGALLLSRNTLLVNLRFMDMALSQLDLIPVEKSTIMTDGKFIAYNPIYVLKCYKSSRETPVRDYLHLVMHCVFRHMYVDPAINREYWDLACDIAVENIISELGLKATNAPREREQSLYLKNIKAMVKSVTAEKVYAYLRSKYSTVKDLEMLKTVFRIDDHAIWYMTEEQKKAAYGMVIKTDTAVIASEEECNDTGESGEVWGDPGEGGDAWGDTEQEKIWEKISERIQMDIETFSKKQGFGAGALWQNLKAVNREKYDYTAFLKKFAVMGEAMKINDDEFDYIFYTYGLQLYGNVPLIEPLEYKEVKRIKEFVIAIDTSGSVSGELVQSFIQKTYNILQSTESFFTKINLHIIQCDEDIQEDVKITNKKDFDNYLCNMKLKGFGGTDFRPVFEHVEKLRKNKEFTNLKGLIYFTDGYGSFPSKKTDYHTAFVFVDDECNIPNVPSWAIKLVLQKEEI